MSERLTDEELKAIQERCEKAHDGPWFFNSYSGIVSKPQCEKYNALSVEDGETALYEAEPIIASVDAEYGDTATGRFRDTAEFIAAAKQDVPRLLDEIAALKAELSQKVTLRYVQGKPHGAKEDIDVEAIEALSKLDMSNL